MSEFRLAKGVLAIIALFSFQVCSETVTLNAVSGNGTNISAWEAGGATFGDDAADSGGTASSYTGKIPNRRLFVPIADTTLAPEDSIYLVQVRVRAKADINMRGTYDGIRISVCIGNSVTRNRAIHELDTTYKYFSYIWAKNPVTGLPWTWADICSLEAGVLTAKTRQGTYATFYVDQIQVIVTWGHDNTPPAASNVAVGGSDTVGCTLTGSYTYSDKESDPEGVSLFQWYRVESSSPNDSLKAAISDAEGKNLVLNNSLEGKYLSFEVTPVAMQGVIMGIPVESDIVGPIAPKPGFAPVASNVKISGSAVFGQTLAGLYTYTDADSDLEAVSTFRWLRDGVAISGAVDTVYRLTGGDVGAMITFEVTPVALTGLPKAGTPAVSAGVGPVGGTTGASAILKMAQPARVETAQWFDINGRRVNGSEIRNGSQGIYIRTVKTAAGVRSERAAIVK